MQLTLVHATRWSQEHELPWARSFREGLYKACLCQNWPLIGDAEQLSLWRKVSWPHPTGKVPGDDSKAGNCPITLPGVAKESPSIWPPGIIKSVQQRFRVQALGGDFLIPPSQASAHTALQRAVQTFAMFLWGYTQKLKLCDATSFPCYLLTSLLPLTQALWTGCWQLPARQVDMCFSRLQSSMEPSQTSWLTLSLTAPAAHRGPQDPPLPAGFQMHVLCFRLEEQAPSRVNPCSLPRATFMSRFWLHIMAELGQREAM